MHTRGRMTGFTSTSMPFCIASQDRQVREGYNRFRIKVEGYYRHRM
jgi:hypothetical protein